MSSPKISVGMPIFNGATYVREAVDSLLAQTFADFELIISDNASTDDTSIICSDYAVRDARIRYVRQAENKGPIANFEYVLEQAVGEYFAWHAADDKVAPTFLEVLYNAIREDAEIVLVMTDVINISDNGDWLWAQKLDSIRLDQHNWWQSEKQALLFGPTGNDVFLCIYGLFRTSVLRTAQLNYGSRGRYNTAAEVPLLAQVSLRGRIGTIPGFLKYYRMHENSVFHVEASNFRRYSLISVMLNVSSTLFMILGDSSLPRRRKVYLQYCVARGFATFLIQITAQQQTRQWVGVVKKIMRAGLRRLGLEVGRARPASPEARELAGILRRVGIDLVFDVGANAGQFASKLRAAGYRGDIVSFEPGSAAFQKLMAAASGDQGWHVHDRTAIGDFDGEIELKNAGNSLSSSMLAIDEIAGPGPAHLSTEKAPIVRLDRVAADYVSGSSRYFVKIDTQGFEWKVLDGAPRTLRGATGISFKLSLAPLYEGQRLWRDVIGRLESEGFSIWAIQPVLADQRNGRLLQIDVILTK